MALKMSKAVLLRCALLLCFVISVNSDNCKVDFKDNKYAHEVPESMYLIDLSIKNTTHGLATTYFPDTQYDIIIRPKSTTLSFKEFHFKMENTNGSTNIGALELRDPEYTTFETKEFCFNRVINLATPYKPNVTIGWQSPPRRTGCIRMVAFVKETELRYHNANLTVCEDPRIELDDPGEIVRNCSVTARAKYEMTFQGVWSKYTHPRDFPTKNWLAGFPTVIGATHERHFRIWEVYTKASEAMKKFAETGNSIDLEMDLKNSNITTLIKFRGTNFKNKTLARAQLQVDRVNHLVSLAARINPSPDWFIGVSALELCKGDSWMESKTLNLYAYDVGSRSGLGFKEENNRFTDDVINHMNMSWPVPQANCNFTPPFYDPHNNTHEVRPMAVIHFQLIRTFGNTYADRPSEEKDDESDKDCLGQWYVSEVCSVTCDKGVKTSKRDYKEGYNATNCPGKVEKKEPCNQVVDCPVNWDERCQLSEWSDWAPCVQVCGQETIGRTRNIKDSYYQSDCKNEKPLLQMHEYKDCGHPPCPNHDAICNDNLYGPWEAWGDCSVTVGRGIKYRQRTLKSNIVIGDVRPDDAGYIGCTYEKQICEGIDPETITDPPIVDILSPGKELIVSTERSHLQKDECQLPMDEGEDCYGKKDDFSNKWAYNTYSNECELLRYLGCGGNANNFPSKEDCEITCYNGPRDCVMEWTEWSVCKECIKEQTRSRIIKVEPSSEGKPCPLSGNLESKPCIRPSYCDASDEESR